MIVDAVLALDRPGMLDRGYVLHELTAGGSLDIGPLQVETRLLPHWLPNAGIRLAAGGRVLACATRRNGAAALADERPRLRDTSPPDLSLRRSAGIRAPATSSGRITAVRSGYFLFFPNEPWHMPPVSVPAAAA
jgi:hypothetical protein